MNSSKIKITKADHRGRQSGPLERYVQILEALTGRTDGLSAGEIERILNLPKTTVNRLLRNLTAADLISTSGLRSASYHLGDRLIRVLRSDALWIEAMSHRFLKGVAEMTNETCFIAKLDGDEITSIAMESPDAGVGIYVLPGHRLPPYATATGKLLIALQEPKAIERHLKMKRSPLTRHTIVGQRELAEELKRIRKNGFAIEKGEHVEGLATIACPIRVQNERSAQFALGLTGPSKRIIRDTARHLQVLRNVAVKLGSILAKV